MFSMFDLLYFLFFSVAPRSSRSKLNFVSAKKEPHEKEPYPQEKEEAIVEETHAVSFIDKISQVTDTPGNAEQGKEKKVREMFSSMLGGL